MMMIDESPVARRFIDALEPHQLVMAAEAVQLLGLNEQAEYLIELAYLGFDTATRSGPI
jgi:helix-turn-helix protein